MVRRIFLLLCLLAFSGGWLMAGEPASVHEFAQVGDGPGIRTVFLLMNQGAEDVNATLRFFDAAGAPLVMRLDATTAASASHTILLAAGQTRRVSTSGTGDTLLTGWAELIAGRDIGAQALFEIRSGETLVTQAAVESPGPVRIGDIFVNSGEGTRTGIAVANLSTSNDVRIQLTLKGEVGADLRETEIILLSRGHRAVFLDEIFTELGTVSGRLCINASGPISVVALQQTGAVLGTLPFIKRIF